MKKCFTIICFVCGILLMGGCFDGTNTVDVTATQMASKNTVAKVDGTIITQEDLDQYISVSKAYHKMLLFEMENGVSNGDVYVKYQYDQAKAIVGSDQSSFLKQYIEDIIVVHKAQEHGGNTVNQQKEIAGIRETIQKMFLALSENQKKEVEKISQENSENLMNHCFPYYAEILYSNMAEYEHFLKKEYASEPMPAYAETEEYLTEFTQWAVNAQKQFEQYKERLVDKADIQFYG